MKHQRFRQPLVWLLITVHVATIYGCSTTNRVTLPGNEIPVGSNFKIATVILKDGEIIEFDSKGGRYVERTAEGKSNRVIIGVRDSKNVEIDPEKVLEVKFEQKESSGTGSFIAGFLIGIAASAGIIVLIVALSYSGR
jgi:hypothetical protein